MIPHLLDLAAWLCSSDLNVKFLMLAPKHLHSKFTTNLSLLSLLDYLFEDITACIPRGRQG